jgi:hypothetical protein
MITPEQWAVYKVITVFITAIFGFYQFTLSKKYRLPDASPWGMRM